MAIQQWKNGTRRLYSNRQIDRMSFPSGISNSNSYVVTDFCHKRWYIKKPWSVLWKQTSMWQGSPDGNSLGYPNTSDFLPRTFGNETVKWKVLMVEIISWKINSELQRQVPETGLCDRINNLPKMNGN